MARTLHLTAIALGNNGLHYFTSWQALPPRHLMRSIGSNHSCLRTHPRRTHRSPQLGVASAGTWLPISGRLRGGGDGRRAAAGELTRRLKRFRHYIGKVS